MIVFCIVDCASIAAISALAHFRRPDVSSGNNEFVIHTAAEKDFIPTVVHHHPISVSFALFNEGKIAVADPTALEERIASGNLVFAINSFKEVCAMHLGGSTLISPDLIFRSANKAAERARRIVEFIKSTLEQDLKERESGSVKGFEDCLRLKKILSKSQKEQVIERMDEDGESSEESSDSDNTAMPEIVQLGPHTVVTKNDLKNFEEASSSDSSEPEEKIAKLEIQSKESKKSSKKNKNKASKSREDSEDEETVVMTKMEP